MKGRHWALKPVCTEIGIAFKGVGSLNCVLLFFFFSLCLGDDQDTLKIPGCLLLIVLAHREKESRKSLPTPKLKKKKSLKQVIRRMGGKEDKILSDLTQL